MYTSQISPEVIAEIKESGITNSATKEELMRMSGRKTSISFLEEVKDNRNIYSILALEPLSRKKKITPVNYHVTRTKPDPVLFNKEAIWKLIKSIQSHINQTPIKCPVCLDHFMTNQSMSVCRSCVCLFHTSCIINIKTCPHCKEKKPVQLVSVPKGTVIQTLMNTVVDLASILTNYESSSSGLGVTFAPELEAIREGITFSLRQALNAIASHKTLSQVTMANITLVEQILDRCAYLDKCQQKLDTSIKRVEQQELALAHKLKLAEETEAKQQRQLLVLLQHKEAIQNTLTNLDATIKDTSTVKNTSAVKDSTSINKSPCNMSKRIQEWEDKT